MNCSIDKQHQHTTMKRTITCILVLLLFQEFASAQFRVKTGAYQGYEWNIFRNPETLIQSEDTLGRSDLWSNSNYNELFVNTDFFKRWGSKRLKLSGDVRANVYHQQNSAQKEFYRLYASYRTKYATRKFFEISPSFSRKTQAPIDQSDLIFRSRFSYSQVLAPLHFDFYLKKQRWLRFETSYRYKSYDATSNDKTHYHGFEAQALYSKRWKGKITSEIELFAEWNLRNQTELEFATQSSPEEIKKRSFESYTFGSNLSFRTKSNSFKIEFPVSYKVFNDSPSNRLDYSQIVAGTKLSFDLGNARVIQNFSGTLRDFSTISVSEDELLNYKFIRSSTTVTVPIMNKFNYIAKASLIRRLSNRSTMRSSSFRGYFSSYIETGISISL